MSASQPLALVLAGGQGSRMDVLTRERAKPALPLAGSFQLIDVSMSNLRHSGIEDVWLAVQYQARSLDDSVANGRPWDLDRTHGGFRLLPPQEGESPVEDGFATGNADQLFRLRNEIAAHPAREVIVLSADHIYTCDLSEVLDTHRRKEAGCTIVTYDLGAQLGIDQAANHATVQSNRLGRVTDFAYKPEEPATGVVATEIFVYDAQLLVDTLGDLHRELDGTLEDEDDSGLGDFGEHLIPRLVDQGLAYEHRIEGYWRDLGRPSMYLAAHRDLARDDQGVLNRSDWPLLTRQIPAAPARLTAGARVDDAMISGGCEVDGDVRRSVLGPRVRVAAGASVRDSVIFADCEIGADAVVEATIMDSGVRVGDRARIGAESRDPDSLADDEIVLIGADAVVPEDAVVESGARWEPGTTRDGD
ncbi:glucose-1-phosphate adenylyltransferase family protein [Gordonia sinesedis]